jgi:hypothetical protein
MSYRILCVHIRNMGLDAGTTLLAVIGIGIIVVGVLILMDRHSPPPAVKEVIVREPSVWRPWGPYYSHLPVRPLVY